MSFLTIHEPLFLVPFLTGLFLSVVLLGLLPLHLLDVLRDGVSAIRTRRSEFGGLARRLFPGAHLQH